MPKPFHILLADDDEDDQFIIKESLKEMSKQIKVTTVNNGRELLDCLNKKNPIPEDLSAPDLILLDINMPLMNGLEVLEKIKASQKLKHIPVFMLSTLRTIERVDKSMELGAQNFYSKPNHYGDYKPIFREILNDTMYSQEA